MTGRRAESAPRPILVTGMHRSGTTWLGKMLCASGKLIDVQEPLNVNNRLTILKSRVPIWYAYITDSNEETFLRAYRDAVAFRAHPFWDLARIGFGLHRSPLRVSKRWASFLLGRAQRRRLLIKDPFAVLSIRWFAQRLNSQIVVTVRHPAAVVSSLKERGWWFDFSDLLGQPQLMADGLERYEREMRQALEHPTDIIGQGSLLWTIIYQAVKQYQAGGVDLRVVRHEDLTADPEREYELLYRHLDLPFTSEARRTVARSANASIWRSRLDADELARIRTLTEEVWSHYYSAADWD
jgi:Sulfotransferase family